MLKAGFPQLLPLPDRELGCEIDARRHRGLWRGISFLSSISSTVGSTPEVTINENEDIFIDRLKPPRRAVREGAKKRRLSVTPPLGPLLPRSVMFYVFFWCWNRLFHSIALIPCWWCDDYHDDLTIFYSVHANMRCIFNHRCTPLYISRSREF